MVLAGIIVIVSKDLEVMKLVVPGVVTLTATAIAGLVGHLNSSQADAIKKAALTLETGSPQIEETK